MFYFKEKKQLKRLYDFLEKNGVRVKYTYDEVQYYGKITNLISQSKIIINFAQSYYIAF